VTRSDVLSLARDGEIRQRMIEQVEARRMPLPPVTITEGDRAILLEWLQLGAPAVESTTCADSDAGAD